MNPLTSPLLTDLYQLTMLQGYYEQGMNDTAVFEFFSRKLPDSRGFLVAAGLEQVLAFLEGIRFRGKELDYLKRTRTFSDDFVDSLADLRFTGDVHAMPEGTVFFADEPIIRVTAPMREAQLVETRVINLLHYETLVASKAARCVLAAPDRLLVDFGLRRAHGAEAGLLAARAAYLAGFDSTATVLAGARFGVPIAGTMAHSFVQAHDSEEQAFKHFALAQRDNCILLIDTYDTEAAARKVVEMAPWFAQHGVAVKAVRLDSGDLADHARKVRRILDEGGMQDTRIFSSGGLDEHELRRLLAEGAPIDGFGIGTHLDVSADAPYLDCVYKLQEYAGIPRRKVSEGKATWPGRKQVYRSYESGGRMSADLLTVESDRQDGEALIVPVMHSGKRLTVPEPLEAARQRCARQLERLPEHLRNLDSEPAFEVTVSDALRELAAEVDRRRDAPVER
jgi:nicotinate phosphoribosyltransferase